MKMTIETKIKSHPKVIYLDTNNFYWAINAVYCSNLKSDNLAKRLHTNKNERQYKKCGYNYIYVPNY